jgi:hypothetical protein
VPSSVEHINCMRKKIGYDVEGLHGPTRAAGQVDNDRGCANCAYAARKQGAPSFLRAHGAHVLGESRKQPFGDGHGRFRRDVARTDSSAARGDNQISDAIVGRFPQEFLDSGAVVWQNSGRGHVPAEFPAPRDNRRAGAVFIFACGDRMERRYPLASTPSVALSRWPSSISRSASINNPVVVREIVERDGAILKSISNSPAGQRTT